MRKLVVERVAGGSFRCWRPDLNEAPRWYADDGFGNLIPTSLTLVAGHLLGVWAWAR